MTPAQTILIVDDEEDIRVLSALMLEPDGYQTTTASTCAEALARIRQGGLDLVLLDLGLPDGNGRDVLRTLKAEGLVPDLPVVIVSAFGQDVVRDELDDLCAVGYIRKPYDMVELRETVRSVFDGVS